MRQSLRSRSLRSNVYALVFSLGLALLLSCSRAPEQYRNTPPPQPARNLDANPATLRGKTIENKDAGRLLGEKAPISREELDRRIRANTYAPILYRQGAGNITFDTTYQKAQDILGEPRGISGSQHLYSEGMVVYWRQDEPRIPDSIIIIIGYQGSLGFPAPWNEVRVDQSFSDAFSTGIADPSADPKAQDLLRKIYNKFEGTDIDCLAQNKCRLYLNEGGSFVVFELPNAYLLFGNNERRKLVQISLFLSKEPGLFRNPVDLLTGKVQVPNSTSASGVPRLLAADFTPTREFGLGQTFAEIEEISGFGADAHVDSYSTYYTMVLGQGTEQILVFEKTDHTSPRPLPTDRLKTIGMYPKYTQPLKFGSKFVQIQPSLLGGVSFAPLDEIVGDIVGLNESAQQSLGRPVAEMGSEDPISEYLNLVRGNGFLSTKASILANNFELQRNFTEGLFTFMQDQARQNLSADWSTYLRISGKYDDRYSREILGTLFMLNPKSQEGRIVELLINETNGDLTFFTSALLNPFEKKTYFAGMEGITAGQNHLMGFTLGDVIYASDFGFARKESSAYGDTAQIATILYKDEKLGSLITRGSYKDNVESSVLYETGNERNITNQPIEMLELPGATLGVNLIGEEEIDGKKWNKYEINVIETTSLFGGIRDICGLSDFDSSIGTYDLHFQDELKKFQAQARQKNEALKARLRQGLSEGKTTAELEAQLTSEEKDIMKYKGCPAVSPTDSLATNLRRAYYFPNHQMKIVFGSRELIKVGIYKKPTAAGGQ